MGKLNLDVTEDAGLAALGLKSYHLLAIDQGQDETVYETDIGREESNGDAYNTFTATLRELGHTYSDVDNKKVRAKLGI